MAAAARRQGADLVAVADRLLAGWRGRCLEAEAGLGDMRLEVGGWWEVAIGAGGRERGRVACVGGASGAGGRGQAAYGCDAVAG